MKKEDCAWLESKIKEQMEDNVSFKEHDLDCHLSIGEYKDSDIEIPFFIKFKKDDMLRIQISLDDGDDKVICGIMEKLVDAVASIGLGAPLAIYEVSDHLTCEYAYKNIGGTIKAIKNNSLYEDAPIENIRFLRICENCQRGSYAYEVDTGKEFLYCTLGGCDIETEKDSTCINHVYEEGEEADIKVLLKKQD